MAIANIYDLAATWNNAGTAFNAIKMDVTNTASAAGSDLIDLGIGGSSIFRVDKRSTVTVAGQSLTGSEALSVLDMAATWNTTGTPSAIKLDVTDTASNANSRVIECKVDGSRVFGVSKTGRIYLGTLNDSFIRSPSADGRGFLWESNSTPLLRSNQQSGFVLHRDIYFSWGNTSAQNPDVLLYRDDAAILALRDGVNEQQFRIYNTYTDASNYELGVLRWSSDVFEIGTAAAGTGTTRNMSITTDQVIAFEVQHVASKVNYLSVLPSATGNATALQAKGTDTDVDLALTPQGAGVVKYGTHSAIGAETVTGFITIKDSAGTSRKIAVVS